MIKMTFLKVLMLIKQKHQKSHIFHYWYFLDKEFKFQLWICNGCYDVLIMSMKLATLNINRIHYRCIINRISKSKTVNLLQNVD